MRLLLDTHIWLWSLREPERLSPTVRRHLDDPTHELWLSAISVWEALVLQEKGKISIPENIADWLAGSTSRLNEAPLTYEVALASRQIGLPHRDPADRFIAATALVLDLTLVTADAKMLGLGEIRTLANR